MKTQVITIEHATYLEHYKIKLVFSDGSERIVDFESFLQKALNPMTTQFRDLKKFKHFHLENGDLLWGNYEMCFTIWDLYEGTI